MLKVTLKGLLAHKLRLGMSAFAIVLGVAFVAGTFVFTDTLNRSFTDLFRQTAPDVTARPAGAQDNGGGRRRCPGRRPAGPWGRGGLPEQVGELFSVSVSTKVPAMNATPRMMANAVMASRSLWASRLLRVALNIAGQPELAAISRASKRFILSSTRSAVGSASSSTIRPSARNSARSA